MDPAGQENCGLNEGRLMMAFAHDLRSHLRTVITRVRMTQSSTEHLREREQTFLADAAGAASEIESLLTAMVTYCSVAAGGNMLDLNVLLRGLTIELKDTLAQQEATLEIAGHADATVPAALKTVFKELILNACRFRRNDAPPHITIVITISGEPYGHNRTLRAVVSDNGIGVEQPYLEKIFEPFQRLHSRGEYPGHGMGLALCRRIVSMNGGSIRAAASAQGGLAVTLTMPLPAGER